MQGKILLALIFCHAATAEVVIKAGGLIASQTYTETVSVQTDQLVTFYGCTFVGSGVLLDLPFGSYCTVWVDNCTFQGTNPNAYGVQGATGIQASCALKLWVSQSSFTGLKSEIYEDANFGYCDVWINSSIFTRQNTRYSDGNGGWLNAAGWGTGVCIMHTRGWNPDDNSWHTRVENNIFANLLGEDEPSDQINLYESTNVVVRGNQISGAKGFYGGNVNANGIVTDDRWSDLHNGTPGQYNWTTAYCIIEGNVLQNASIGVWAGHDNQFLNNTVKNSGVMANGEPCPVPLIGIGRYDPGEGKGWAESNVVSGNTVSSVFEGQPYNYDNQAGEKNWTNNTRF